MRIGHYELRAEIGRGAVGVVHAALDSQAGRRVAVKLLLTGAGASDYERRRFEAEVRAMLRLRHPGIVWLPTFELREEGGRLLARVEPRTRRQHPPHEPHRLARAPEPRQGPLRVLGISTTAMTEEYPRFSISEALLEAALARAGEQGAEGRLLRLGALHVRACEGFCSKSAQACTWPCSLTLMDPDDQMEQVYEGLVHWADVVLMATPIRWGAASSLYYKMAERLNCVQNALTTRDVVLIRDKVAGFIITGGQDNVQGVAGQLLGFFAELGFVFPPFPYVAHSRGWSAEDMENDVAHVRHSEELRAGTRQLVDRALELARRLRASSACPARIARGGRKAHRAPGG